MASPLDTVTDPPPSLVSDNQPEEVHLPVSKLVPLKLSVIVEPGVSVGTGVGVGELVGPGVGVIVGVAVGVFVAPGIFVGVGVPTAVPVTVPFVDAISAFPVLPTAATWVSLVKLIDDCLAASIFTCHVPKIPAPVNGAVGCAASVTLIVPLS